MQNYPQTPSQLNLNYVVRITGTDEAGNQVGGSPTGIIAALPEAFEISTQSNWEPILDNANIGQAAGGGLIGSIGGKFGQALTGISLNSANATQLLWSGTTPIDFRLRLIFNAITNPQTEVMLPIESLLSLALPSPLSTGSGTGSSLVNLLGVRAPGPTITDQSQYNIKMYIGQSMCFQNVIIRSVSATIESMFDDQGDWLFATADVDISTSRIYTKDIFKQCFITSNSNVPQLPV